MTLTDLLKRHFETPQIFAVDEELTMELAEYRTEIADLFINATDARTRLVCAGSLARVDRSYDEQVLPVLMMALHGQDETELVLAASCVGLLGAFATPAASALIELLRHEESNVVCEAAYSLGSIGASESVLPLIEVLENSMAISGECDAAVIALGELGPVAQEAIPSLQRCLTLDGTSSHAIRQFRMEAAEAIWQITGDTTEALAVAMGMLDDKEWLLVCNACQLLGKLGSAAQPAAEKLRELIHHHYDCVRREAAQALVRCWFD
jgi:hypothetical protein